MSTFDDLIADIRKARKDGERILKEQGIENVELGPQNVMLQFWQVEAVVEEVERLRNLIEPKELKFVPVKEAIPFNKNLKKDKE